MNILQQCTQGEWYAKATTHDILLASVGGPRTSDIAIIRGTDEEAQANAKLIAGAKTMAECLDEVGNRIAYCLNLWQLPEEAVAMLKGEMDTINRCLYELEYHLHS